MPSKIEALGILLILLPGLLTAYISQQLAVRREQTEFDKTVEALVQLSSLLGDITVLQGEAAYRVAATTGW